MTNLQALEQLGRELVARGRAWGAFVPPLRVLYRATREGTPPAWNAWNLEHGLKLAGMLGIGAGAWPVHKSTKSGGVCPRCPAPETTGRPWERAILDHPSLPDRAGYECLRCGLRWVELHHPALAST